MITIIIVLAVFAVIVWAMVATDIKESAGRTAESAGEYMDDAAIAAMVKREF